jgi:hypothetical protein
VIAHLPAAGPIDLEQAVRRIDGQDWRVSL